MSLEPDLYTLHFLTSDRPFCSIFFDVPLTLVSSPPSLSAEPLRTQVRAAFANSLEVVWQVMIGLAGLGFLVSFGVESLTLSTEADEKWGLEENPTKAVDEEKARE